MRKRISKRGKPHLFAVPIRFCSRRGLPCRVCCQPRGALLPHPFTLTFSVVLSRSALLEAIWPAMRRHRFWKAVCFLWHFPWGRPRRTLSGAVFPWSPDFPPLQMRYNREGPQRAPGAAAIRPTGTLCNGVSIYSVKGLACLPSGFYEQARSRRAEKSRRLSHFTPYWRGTAPRGDEPMLIGAIHRMLDTGFAGRETRPPILRRGEVMAARIAPECRPAES